MSEAPDLGAVEPDTADVYAGKTRITIRLDDELLDWFRARARAAGRGNYQTLINTALREYVRQQREPLEETLRRVLREELRRALAGPDADGSANLDPARGNRST